MVLDHLNTHKPASLYDVFPPAEARRILTKLALHDTPKHGSWLNMAEIELSVLQRQGLDRRIPDEDTLKRENRRLGITSERHTGRHSPDLADADLCHDLSTLYEPVLLTALS